MDISAFHKLGARQRAMVAIAVLLDGFEAASYLESDSEKSDELQSAAMALSNLAPEVRMPLAGSLLRTAIEELTS
jgi:hypothetical protein